VATRAAATSAGFEFADALPWFAGRNIRRLTNSFLDSHPNPAGHRVLAAGAAEWLADDFPP
jgi:lysophospholipase L1-like esterase